MSEIIITNKEEAIHYYQEMVRMESAVKVIKKALENYVKANGNINDKDADVFIGIVPNEPTWTFKDINQVYQNIFFDGLDANDFLNIPPSNAKKLAEIWGDEGMKLAGGFLKPKADSFKIQKYKK